MKLGERYSRQEVQEVFAPDYNFVPQAGTWGLHGILNIPERRGSYVFFVTYGQHQGDHVFDEGITSEGVLSWQSQPSQHFEEERVRDFISHDEAIDSIYLFLREKKGIPYTFLGTIGYLTHDATRERPVWFQWQLLDWDEIPPERRPVASAVPLSLDSQDFDHIDVPEGGLLLDLEPPSGARQKTTAQSFRGIKSPDYSGRDERNRKLGLAGELLAIEAEKRRLRDCGREDLSKLVVHTSQIEGDGAGYDIASFRKDGTPLHIEVKTTKGHSKTDFFMSARELEFSRRHPDTYQLLRLYNFDSQTKSARAYMLEGDISSSVKAIPTNFRMKLS